MSEQDKLHLWLAEKTPELRLLGKDVLSMTGKMYWSKAALKRDWVPNVTTDGVLEALRRKGWKHVDFSLGSVGYACWIDKSPAAPYKNATGSTPHEALCRAARKALEVSDA